MITIPEYIKQHIHNLEFYDGKVTKAMSSASLIDGFEGLSLNINRNTPITFLYKGCTFSVDYQGFINWVNRQLRNNP